MEYIERRRTDLNPEQTEAEIFKTDVASLNALREQLNIGANDTGKIALLIRREQDEAKAKLVDAVVKHAATPDNDQEGAAANVAPDQREITPEQIEEALSILKTENQAEANRELAPTLDWQRAQEALREQPEVLRTVLKAKAGGHEPTIYFADEEGFDIDTRAKETPPSTRNCVYDAAAEELEKKRNPGVKFNGNAVDQARAMGWGLMRASQGGHIARETESYFEDGWSWYDKDEDTRSTGCALRGLRSGRFLSVIQSDASVHRNYGGWRGTLRVLYKKA